MLSIGQFSKLTGLSQKTLIWYDNIDLLKPDYVNEENGYRYYKVESIEKVADIHFWQTLEFSINDIKNLSSNLIDEKIEQLREKIRNIEKNIYLLNKIKEDSMKDYKERAKAFGKLLCGKWHYEGDYDNLNQILKGNEEGIKNRSMPKYLFFGKDGLGTDLSDTFNYSENIFSRFNDIEYHFFLLDAGNKMVVYYTDKKYEKEKLIKFHLYKNYNSDEYTNDDIERLLSKYKKEENILSLEFNENLVGKWNLCDIIKESQLDIYDGSTKRENVSYIMPLIYKILDISKDKNVYIMKEDDDLTLEYSDGEKRVLTRENTINNVIMNGKSEDEFSLYSCFKENLKCKYKKIGEDEYIFADLKNSPELDAGIYVFIKQK